MPLGIAPYAVSDAVLVAFLSSVRLSATSHKLALAVLLPPVSLTENVETASRLLSITDDLIVDTGSGNTCVGPGYVETITSHNTGEPVCPTGSDSCGMTWKDFINCDIFAYLWLSVGTEYTDTVSLGNGLTITQQSICVISASTGFTGIDGILGIGPEALTPGTLTNEPNTMIPTVLQNLYTQGVISEIVVGISFEPTNSDNVTNGELTFGGTDPTKYTGTIAYAHVVYL
jgi:hypothetical protein